MTFPALSVGLAIFLVICYGAYCRTGNPLYLQMFPFWRKIFALGFALGIVVGFIGILLYGEGRVSKRVTMVATCLAASGRCCRRPGSCRRTRGCRLQSATPRSTASSSHQRYAGRCWASGTIPGYGRRRARCAVAVGWALAPVNRCGSNWLLERDGQVE
jgi:hypothetical protein